MKQNNSDSEKINLLQQFAVKSQKKKIIYGDKAVTYNRCSTEKQDSLQWQEKVTADYVKQMNWILIKSFGEKESATTDDRIEFQEMLKFCKKEHISHIVFYSYDRFSRTGDSNLLKELREKGIKVHAATQGADDETPSGRMTQKMYLMFAEMENEQRREKVIEGQKNKLRKGEWIAIPALGYEKKYVTGKKEHDHDKPQCFIDEKGQLLRQAFYWKDRENISNVEVIERLKKMGLALTPSQLTRVFRNPFYCGYITSRLLDDGELFKGKHEPLVGEEIFLRVNGIVNGNPHGWKMLQENNEMSLKASIRCGKCDRLLTAYPQKGKYIYYKCPNNGCCVNISNKKLHQLFEMELSKFTLDEKLIPAIKSQIENTYRLLNEHDTAREKPMKDELTHLKNELEKMEFNLAVGKVSQEIYARHSASHLQKIKAIENELKNLFQDTSNLAFYLNNIVSNVGNLLKMWQNLDYTGKVRLQKLIYPNGLAYMPEIHAVRTSQVNPIFLAISSISQILSTEAGDEQCQKNQKLHSVYSMFASSNFFWENLEKITKEFADLEERLSYIQNPVVSVSGQTPNNYVSNTTKTLDINLGICSFNSITTNIFSGSTNLQTKVYIGN